MTRRPQVTPRALVTLSSVLLLVSCTDGAPTPPVRRGADDRRTVADWFDQLEVSKDAMHRQAALLGIRDTPFDTLEENLPLLEAKLGHADPALRVTAAGLLLRLGERGRAAAPRLLKALEDDDAFVATTAAQALIALDQHPASALHTLFQVTESSADTRLKNVAAKAIYRVASAPPAVLQLISEKLRSERHESRALALLAATCLKQRAAPLTAQISPLLEDPQPRNRKLAKDALDALAAQGEQP